MNAARPALRALLPAAAALGVLLLPAAPAAAYDVGRGWKVDGAVSMNFRGLGNAREVEVENQLALTSVYFGLEGPSLRLIPLRLQFTLDEQGSPQLHQAVVAYRSYGKWSIEAGKFVVPFGRYNQLYRPGDILTVTHPLMYADPRNYDTVLRVNSPRPVFSHGYADLGAHGVYYARSRREWMPDKLHLYVVNGLGESVQAGQGTPDPRLLVIPPDPPQGVDIDWEHRRTELGDNNDAKTVGARLEWDVGDFDVPFPVPEGRTNLEGVQFGLSAMDGKYDVRDRLPYTLLGADAAFQYGDFAFTLEGVHSQSSLSVPVVVSSAVAASGQVPTLDLRRRRTSEVNWGTYAQVSFPIVARSVMRRFRAKGRVLGVIGYSWMERIGWELEKRNAATTSRVWTADGVPISSFNTIAGCGEVNSSCQGQTIRRTMEKLTAGIDYKVTEYFGLKIEYSYWAIEDAADLNQTALAAVLQF